jgi:hypothetical protein
MKVGTCGAVDAWRCPISTGFAIRCTPGAVYNLAIPNVILNSVSRAPGGEHTFRIAVPLLVLVLLAGLATIAAAADWNIPEQQLARKVVAVSDGGPLALAFANRSSLGRRDAEIIQNGLRSALESAGARFAKADAAPTVKISLSENLNSYVWVAEVRRREDETAVVMVSTPRPEGAGGAQDSVPLSILKIPLWTQTDPILDVAVLEESGAPNRIAVLSPSGVTLYTGHAGAWQAERSAEIPHAQPWPRDVRGRIILVKDHQFDVFLPGIVCHGMAPLNLTCLRSDDAWPLTVPAFNLGAATNSAGADSVTAGATIPPMGAFFAPARNFFTGALTSPIGKFTNVPKFYSAAVLSRDKPLWLFGATDGFVHVIDGTSDQPLRLAWGSDLTSVKTSCGAGWQILATGSDDGSGNSVRAYEIPDRDPLPVSAAVDFSGPISALWTEVKGDTAVAVAKNQVTGNYEAFRLAVACHQ